MELLRKLNHKGNGAVYVMDSLGEFYDSIEKMKEETEVVTSFTTKSHVPLLLVFIRDKADLLAKMDEVKRMIDSNTILWFAYLRKNHPNVTKAISLAMPVGIRWERWDTNRCGRSRSMKIGRHCVSRRLPQSRN